MEFRAYSWVSGGCRRAEREERTNVYIKCGRYANLRAHTCTLHSALDGDEIFEIDAPEGVSCIALDYSGLLPA